MGKTLFIIPGYRQAPGSKAYREIARMVKNHGFLPMPVNIPWNKPISDNTDYFFQKFKGRIGNSSILGFSYGAMIAFIASTKISVKSLILCSLSPFFKEDMAKEQRPRYRDFVNLSSENLAKQIRAKQILLLYGEKEDRFLINRVMDTYSEIPNHNKSLIKIKNTEHNIADQRYLDKIHRAIQQLN